MIYEVRTDTLQLNMAGEFLKRFGEAYESARRKHSELVGCWFTDIGPLNQVIRIWSYDSHEARTAIQAAAEAEPGWPPEVDDLVVHSTAETFRPLPCSPVPEPGTHGPIYEMRIYEVVPGTDEDLRISWERAIPGRTALSPCSVLMLSDSGSLRKLIHIWPYPDFETRSQVRRQAVAEGLWPPSRMHPTADPRGPYFSQDNLIMLPAAFSPMQ